MTRAWVRELAGWTLAAAVALATAASVASSARAELLFRDGDSLIVAMLSRSVLAGEPFDWALSSVLFLPETALFTALDALLPLDANGLLALSAVVNQLALFGAIRLAAGPVREGRSPIAWSVAAILAFGVIAATETSSSRDALELASLQLTTTYYSATVVAVVLMIGILRRSVDSRARLRLPVIASAALAAVSTLTNPLFAAWAVAPLSLVLLVLGLRTAALRVRFLVLTGALLGGAAIGAVARIPLAAWIANTGAGYAQPSRWRESLSYHGDLVIERLQSPLGLASALVIAALLGLAVLRTVRAASEAERLVAVVAWVTPLIVLVGAVALGTHAARYLQPLVLLPVLALVSSLRTARLSAPLRRTFAAIAAVLLVAVGILGIPRLAAAATVPDPDLDCVTAWIDGSGRIGAGQFWTVRLPKLHLGDPSQLVQVDHRLDAYAWLVNRADFDAGEVTFLLEDAQTVGWDLPDDVDPLRTVECGRYSILDFETTPLPLGPAHS
ncbi:hypothetical protein [Microbacterium sp. H83]|uniref:hypothetical protein n=1 Tax=Microbacterium sp. H83 TaxID=1827324 RepID=UPI0007F32E31|nr:hypothetical protein [Microbacterium sp. H83]OAN34053.1 hypothetical protein A4X16_06180 [Microbacterium sp. H83]